MFSFELMFQPLKRYFDFQGRARRSEYWLFYLFQLVVSIAFNILQLAGGAVAGLAAGLSLLFSLGILIPSIAVGVRRFHDTNRTGFWILLWPVVYFISLIVFVVFNLESMAQIGEAMQAVDPVAMESGDPAAMAAIFGALGPMLLWVGLPTWLAGLVTFVFHVQDGTPGANRFGPDPKGRGVAADVASTFS